MTHIDIFWLVASFIFGSALGSFLNVCIWRLPRGKSLIWPPSHCTTCFQPIGRFNVPIVGYFIVGGKCRECGEKFSIRYPLVELMTAVIVSLFYWRFVVAGGAPLAVFFAYASLAAMLVVATFVDLDWKIIPGKLTAFGIILAAVFSTICPRLHSLYIGVHAGGGSWMESLGRLIAKVPQIDGLIASLGGMAAGVIVILVVRYLGTIVFRREAMGLGDARLMAVIGGFLGWRAIPVVFMLAAFVGAVIGAVSYFKTREREIPLGPFLALGALVVMLLGNELVRWWFVGLMHLDWSPQILSYSP